MAVTIPYTFTANTKAKAAEVNANFTALKNKFAAGIVAADLSDVALLNATKHGDLSGSTSTMHTAESVDIADAGSLITATNVEDALQEMQTAIDNIEAGSILAAEDIPITDSGGYYSATEVEAALQEIGAGSVLTASDIPITDSGSYYSATEVEAALQEVGVAAGLGLVGGGPMKYVGKSYHATDHTAAVVTVSADTADTAILIITSSYLNTNANNGDVECALVINNEAQTGAEYLIKAYGTTATTVKGTWSKIFVVTNTELGALSTPSDLSSNNTFRLNGWTGSTVDGDFTVAVFAI